MGNNGLVHLKSLRQNIALDVWFGPENSIGYGNDARVLAAQGGERNGIRIANVFLEVDKANRENKRVALV